jgi:hypothetical protein
MAMLIPMMAFVVAYCYPLYVNVVVRERMDEGREWMREERQNWVLTVSIERSWM